MFSVLASLQGRNSILCKICTNARKERVREREEREPCTGESFQDIPSETPRVLRTYQSHFTKFPPLENAVLETPPFFSPARVVSIASANARTRARRAENLFLAEDVRGIILKSRRVVSRTYLRLRRNAKSAVGAPSLLENFVPGKTFVANLTL